jgi:hypothetical protein
MISGRHLHSCRFCDDKFECARVTHCKLDSFDPDEEKRPMCPDCAERWVKSFQEAGKNSTGGKQS